MEGGYEEFHRQPLGEKVSPDSLTEYKNHNLYIKEQEKKNTEEFQ